MSEELSRLFHEALDQAPESRESWIEQTCTGNVALATQLRALLAAHATEAGFLDQPVAQLASRLGLYEPRAGDTIGPYRLSTMLGRGGMGLVYRAERIDASFAQIVALKLMRTEKMAGDARARFLLERRILARLTHPHIARLVDGGFSAADEPWFAMEFVDGEPLLHWCATHRLTLSARLELLLTICEAVEFAHTRLIVHRDIKPSNILVDAHGTAKLLDFGIAKLLDDSEQVELATGTQTKLLTAEYASPEQVRGEAVTTATDVHALGLLLYELLCGQRAFGAKAQSAFDVQRDVLDTDPPAMSARLTQLQSVDAAAAQRIAADRQFDLARFKRHLKGDLQHIVDKAIRKEPAQRYASVGAFADDLRRYLANEPVAAASGAGGYRLRKFLGRHRTSVVFGCLIVLALIGGIVGIAWQAHRANQQAELARNEATRAEAEAKRATAETKTAEAERDFLVNLFDAAGPNMSLGKPTSAIDLLDAGAKRIETQLKDQPLLQAWLSEEIGAVNTDLGRYDDARPLLKRARDLAVAQEGERSTLSMRTAVDLVDIDNSATASPRAIELFDLDRAIDVMLHERRSDQHTLLIRALRVRSFAALKSDLNYAIVLLQEAAKLARDEADKSILTVVLIDLGNRLQLAHRYSEAIAVLREVLQHSVVALHPQDKAQVLTNLGASLDKTGGFSEAETLQREGVELNRNVYGDSHPRYAIALQYLAITLIDENKLDEAETALKHVLAIFEKNGGVDGTMSGYAYNHFASLRAAQKRLPEAIEFERRSVAISEREPEASASLIIMRQTRLAGFEYDIGDYAGVEREAHHLLDRAGKPGYEDLGEMKWQWGRALRMQGRNEEALAQLKQAQADKEKTEGPNGLIKLRSTLQIAQVQRDLGQLDEASRSAQQALTEFEHSDPATPADVIDARYLLAQIDYLQGHCAGSIKNLEARWEDRKQKTDAEDPTRAAEAGLMVGLCRKQMNSADQTAYQMLIQASAKTVDASKLADPFFKRLAQSVPAP